MRRRSPDADEELEGEDAELAPEAGDLGALLLSAQGAAGNAALADMMSRIEEGETPATALLPGRDDTSRRDEERDRQGAADRATHTALKHRIVAARGNPFSRRVHDELRAVERRLDDAREYGWLGTDAAVLASELDEVEDKLRRAEDEEEATHALAAVDLRRKPLSERVKKAITEHVAITKPGMAIYAPEDFEELGKLGPRLAELQKRLIDNGTAAAAARTALGGLSDAATAYARTVAARLADDVEKAAGVLKELELLLAQVTDRHARANAEDREQLTKLMEGLGPRYQREPRAALAGGAGRQEIEYLVKKAWLEQHDATQKLAKDEVWQLVTGFSPEESRVCYFDLPERMDKWRIHFSLDYGVMRAIEAGASDQDVRDALLGGGAAMMLRSHVTAEVLGRDDDRNPRLYYGAGRSTPRREFWETREGKEVKRNWGANQARLADALDGKAEELVKIVHDVLQQRLALKSLVVKVGEQLTWAD